ncbi:uncharacterized protein GGS22DRAFT_65574 [Annulohypoxylon maeteangense]|uniref:uncharacterized protein n=1 Tax=Annulohypoxylon maeteangense TaxID=1927788 RepID=UPI002007F25F|nr:uncharacterized protein GGS22DRAFT_65574 [Annulohypoxylon maeteangense]KAI0888980.1 hypothetical protein GGS22DRAFT_65574 [Annulohypoxylon maeteangense]
MNYTRKRALLACDFCRHRKRRCDGKKPCSTCRDSNADCVYKELPFDRVEDSSPTAVIDRLARIENLLEHQSQQINHLSTRSSPLSYPTSQADYFATYQQPSEYLPSTSAAIDPQLDSPQFLIPKNHATLPITLLSLPMVRDLIGEYPRDYFFEIEEKLPLPGLLGKLYDSPLVWPSIDADTLDVLSENYFRNVHPHHPLFTPAMFKAWQDELIQEKGMEEIGTAICFCVYALGTICSNTAGDYDNDEALGIQFFQPALRIILHKLVWEFRPSINLCQALLLAASYFAHLGRPLHSWKMAQFSSRMFLGLLESRQRYIASAEFEEAELRTFWQCFTVECDRIAELDVPRSGIEPLGDRMRLPHSTDPSDNENTIYFIAEHAIRRLLNRIHNSLYGPEIAQTSPIHVLPTGPNQAWQSLNMQKLQALSAELNRQLEEWYFSIPDYLRPVKGTLPLPNDRARVLRIRYYAARHIIHRPFLLQMVSRQCEEQSPASTSVLSPDSYSESTVFLERCETCIDSCVTYLYNAIEMIDRRSPYLWTFSQSCLACLIMLWMADNTPALHHYLPHMQPIQNMLLTKLRKWAIKDSTFAAEIHIIEQLVFSDPMEA